MPFSVKRQMRVIQQNVPYVPGASTAAMAIPTDKPITKIEVTISGTPAGTTSSAGTLQNAFLVPAMARALGMFTITGSPQDGSDGLQMKNIPFWLAYLDSWLMNAQQPLATDIVAATPATALSVTVPIHFMDERLDDSQAIYTCLEAMRYGSSKNLNLQILFGNIYAATNANPDINAIVGGTYSGGGVGTLQVQVAVEQLFLLNQKWPAWNSSEAFPMLDRDFEYQPQIGLVQSQSNGITLNRRRIQANTIFLNSGQVATTLSESGINNLGVTPVPQMVERIGANPTYTVDPTNMQADSLQKLLYGQSASNYPAGLYFNDDWNSNLANAASLLRVNGDHTWDTNLAAIPSGYAQQSERLLHITYNPSAAAMKASPNL